MRRSRAKVRLERDDEFAGGRRLSTRKAPVGRQDETAVVAATCDAAVVDRDEVALVVGDEHTILGPRPVEEIFVGGAAQIGTLCDCDDILIALAQLLCNRCRIVG
jgi:hypothetical protein